MNRQELFTLLSSIGIPVAYKHWEPDNAPLLPYAVYRYANNDSTVKADNINYIEVNEWALELYTASKDDDLEASIEAMFGKNEISFSKTEAEIQKDFYQVFYLFQTI